MIINSKVKLPVYLREIDGWLYDNPKKSRIMDNKLLCNLISLGNHSKLINALVKEIKPGEKVLQMGGTFGGEIDAVADAIGANGRLDIMDVSRTQVQRLEEKYSHSIYTINIVHQDVRAPIEEKYDLVICYMLLHEMPILSKIKTVNNALNAISDKGRVVFIDYHNPGLSNPLKYFVRMWNRLLQPFAEKLWDREINSFANKHENIIWRKTTYFGKMYQKVIAAKK